MLDITKWVSPNRARYWTPEKLSQLPRLVAEGNTIAEIAEYFGTSYCAVKHVLDRQGLKAERSAGVSINWTPAVIERAKQLRMEGYSSGKIASQLGISRNAVIGKLGRMGIKGPRSKSSEFRFPTTKKNLVKADCERALLVNIKIRKAPPRDEIEWNSSDGPEPLRVPLMDAGAFQCRKVLEGERGLDGRHMFCGLPTVGETSYCAFHKALFHVRPRR